MDNNNSDEDVAVLDVDTFSYSKLPSQGRQTGQAVLQKTSKKNIPKKKKKTQAKPKSNAAHARSIASRRKVTAMVAKATTAKNSGTKRKVSSMTKE